MKKILFTLLLVAGGFVAQAQTPPGDQGTLEFTIFDSGSSTYGVAAGDNINDRCVEAKAASGSNSAIENVQATLVYSIDASGQRYRGTTRLGAPNTRFLTLFQGGNFYRIYTRDGRNFGNARNLTDSN